MGGNTGQVSPARPLAYSSWQEAWANEDTALPPMRAGIKFRGFVGGANAMISVRSVGATTAEIDIAVVAGLARPENRLTMVGRLPGADQVIQDQDKVVAQPDG